MNRTRRLLAVSHPASAEANQSIYAALADLGWDVRLVLPRWWIDGFNGQRFATRVIPRLARGSYRVPIIQAGKPQRHMYLAPIASIVRRVRPSVAFVEQEPFSASAWQWGGALHRAGVPFAVQHAEDLDREIPAVARVFRRHTLRRAAFVAARSPKAAELLSGVTAFVVPHPVAELEQARPKAPGASFVVGYAGRLVEAKGVRDLLEAMEQLQNARLLVVGDGPLRNTVEEAARETGRIELMTHLRHSAMQEAYAKMDVLVLPSRTTPTWTEQFGRVLVEALWCGVPVVGSSSGEIPWVIEVTGGGLVFPEGDVAALANALAKLRDDHPLRRHLALTGQHNVADKFSMTAVARQMDKLLTELLAGDVQARRPPDGQS